MDKTDRLILFPCPFCGGKAYSMVHVKRGTSYDSIVATVKCEICCASQSSAMQSGNTIEALQEVCMKAVKAWNDRKPLMDLPYFPKVEKLDEFTTKWTCLRCGYSIDLNNDESPKYCLNCGRQFMHDEEEEKHETD